jgi:hypothetical protein
MTSDRWAGTGLHISRSALVRTSRPERPGNGPVVTTTIHPKVWKRALALSGRNLRRLERKPDGSVVIHNREGNYNG